MNITNFIKRNMPIFIIGFLTLLVFVGIIIAGEKQGNQSTALKIVNQGDLVADFNYFKGPEDSEVTLVEFSDFECPACAAFQTALKTIELEYPALKIVYKHFPLPQHANALEAARASMAAGEQDAFWEYHDLLFQNQSDLREEDLIQYAKDLGLDTKKFEADMKSEKLKTLVETDIKTGDSLGVSSTPTFFLNGRLLELKQFEDLSREVADEFRKLNVEKGEQEKKTSEVPASNKLRSQKEILLEDQGDKILAPTYEIEITSDGFKPQEAEIALGQVVVWTNNTEKPVLLKPSLKNEVYPELKEGVTIQPKEKYEFKPYKTDRFDYYDETSLKFGYVLPYDISKE